MGVVAQLNATKGVNNMLHILLCDQPLTQFLTDSENRRAEEFNILLNNKDLLWASGYIDPDAVRAASQLVMA